MIEEELGTAESKEGALRQFIRDSREAYWVFKQTIPHLTFTVLRWLVALLAVVLLFEILLGFLIEPNRRSFSDQEIIQEVKQSAQVLAQRVTKLRDQAAADMELRTDVNFNARRDLIQRVLDIKQTFDDSLKTFIQQEDATDPHEQYSLAIYSGSRQLLAWSSTIPYRSSWDTVLAEVKHIEHKSRAIYVERRGKYVWLTALRKISDTSNQGYILSRALLSYAANEKHSNLHSFDFLEPLAHKVEHVLNLDYTASSAPGSQLKDRAAIIAEQGEPATYVGTLRIGEQTAHEETGLTGFLAALRELLLILLIYFAIGSITYVLLKRPDLKERASIRLQTAEVVLALFIVARIAIMLLGNLGTLLPASAQDTDIFAISDLAGIAGNPLELFLTVITIAASAALIAKVITTSVGPKQLTISFWKFSLNFLIFIGLQIVFVHGLKYIVGSIITNSTISYNSITQAIPDIPILLVYFSLVSIGFVYCIAAVTTLVWFLTSSIPLLRLENYEVLVGRGIALVIVVLLFTSAGLLALAPSAGYLLSENYWIIVVVTLLLITATVWLSQLKSAASTPSARISIISGLAILVLVSSGSIIVAPLISSIEIANRVTILEVSSRTTPDRTLEFTARLEAAFMGYLPQRDTNPIQFAMDVVDQLDGAGPVVTRALLVDGQVVRGEGGAFPVDNIDQKLLALSDSLLRNARGAPYIVRTIAGDSLAANLPFERIVIGTLRLQGTPARQLVVLFAPTEPSTPSLYVRAQRQQRREVRALYQSNTLRQVSDPSLNIPTHLPPGFYTRAQSYNSPVRTELSIDDDRYAFVSRPSESDSTTVVLSGLRLPAVTDVFEIVLHVHFLGILLAIIYSILSFIIRALFTSEQQVLIRFRERILLIVIALAFIPLMLVTNVTRSLLGERESAQKQDQLIADVNATVNKIRNSADSVSRSKTLQDAASTLNRSIQLYDMRGILRLADDESVIRSGLISTALDIGAANDIIVNGKTFTLEDMPVGSTSVIRSAFQVVTSSSTNEPIGIVAVREVDAALHVESNIAATISFIYGVFAAVAVLLLLIGALFAYLLSRPISKVIQATEQVAGGAYGVVVPIDRKDEMGDLANAFNRMSEELDKSRERLAQSQREVAWKEMARQVAHEIKNPLTPMKLSVQHVEHAFESKDENFATIFRRVMRTLSEQIAVLTRIASEFSRFGEMPRRRYAFISLKKVTESAVALFDADRGRIRFVVDIPDNLSAIYADEEEFRRCLVNLVRNAVQAIEKWGVIIISARERQGLIHTTITDTGSGIPKETLAKIFDPNFSTKTSGMGLGLAIVKRSITDMSGQISVESEVGKGTTFHIDLPAREFPAV